MSLTLILGNKNYSSWSLRAWLYLKQSQLEFEEVVIPLFTEQWAQTIGQYSPSRRVPVLIEGDLTVWDTMAIFEYLLETCPQAVGWPRDRKARAVARSISAEMHAGFLGVRGELPQNIRTRCLRPLSSFSVNTQQEIQRIQSLWSTCKQQYGQQGDWLFGDFSIADVMYVPVALRFVTYGIPIEPSAQFFMDAVQALPAVQQWAQAAAAEPERLTEIDALAAAG